MTDMEKVIDRLNDCMEASRRDNTWVFIRKDIVEDALELLKEQNAQSHDAEPQQPLWKTERVNKKVDMVKVVRCEYCKHRPTPPKAFGAEINGRWCYWCEHLKSWKPDDWFCADGEREN